MMSQPNRNEDPFDLIQRGNAFHSSSSHWSAADAYSRASLALRHRANVLSASAPAKKKTKPTKKENDGVEEEEEEKIISLYRAQSLEYFYKARQSLLTALAFENDQDRRNTCEVAKMGAGALDPTCCFIGREEGERRRRMFERLFIMDGGNKECMDRDGGGDGVTKGTREERNVEEGKGDNTVEMDIPHAPSTLLVVNNSTTASAAANDDPQKRLNDIHSGLKRLGVSLPDDYQSNKHYVLGIKPMSNEDQVKLIIQQATDEVQVETASNGTDEKHDRTDWEINENDSMFDGYQEHIDDDDEDNDLDTLLIKVEKMAASMSKRDESEMEEKEKDREQHQDHLYDNRLQMIRNAQALLLEARLCLELEREEEDMSCSGNDSDEFSGGQKDTSTDNGTVNEAKDDSVGCHRRRKARDRIDCAVRCLQHGLSTWV
ncbi:hypothetical protein HJC23_011968 [Cyclotella cryptica]|uniref:Uncharacterized protein n=1 Tax=Cyclotella cryptica TaxID=29204 RepID=A0ABD3QQE4_9STRA|eukprot:CCRYP_003012-RA/>CCRYP_003012-RA protein AED:0.30 eAED:0.30 QI:0/-1/0/1/-1/1/1/0/431